MVSLADNEIDHNAGNASGTATITLHFSEAVTVTEASTGAPTLSLNDGGVATYVGSSSNGTELIFSYTPANSGNEKTPALAITAVNLNGGTINDTATDTPANTAGADVVLSPDLGVNEPAAPAGVAGAAINLALMNSSSVQNGTITVTLTGVPSDWSLNEGTKLGNGAWTVVTNNLSALTVTTPAVFAGAMLLGVTESWTNADGTKGLATFA